jgi:hypothetical protein
MAQWQSKSAICADFYGVDTTQEFGLGTIVTGEDKDEDTYNGSGEFMYVQGVASAAAGSVLLVDPADYTTSLAVANDVGPVGAALAAIVANTYGWIQVQGKATCKVAASFAAGTPAYLTATGGTLDDAVVAGDEVFGAVGLSAIDTPTTGQAYVYLNRSFVTNASN